jgi:thiol:disulfide interchange protein DsbG
VYLFDDPMCGYCHEFYKLTREAIEQGKLQLRHVMVGVVTANSELVAAQIFDAGHTRDPSREVHAGRAGDRHPLVWEGSRAVEEQRRADA